MSSDENKKSGIYQAADKIVNMLFKTNENDDDKDVEIMQAMLDMVLMNTTSINNDCNKIKEEKVLENDSRNGED
ncbi:Hypothetical protein SRAE_2000424400 [Strongyloides ratti]|uniref:Uncharacterized protein n=1 Tax=Strongyloides ratti TaxID=34506 RepID=A0A090LPW6_STRRB|nr:Hypothetical protein SRAE_2000424400 [Strongyloides ratti]CEF69596.1 Hypothetical protein SRAE_2000424400 [Strongyloides ratti]